MPVVMSAYQQKFIKSHMRNVVKKVDGEIIEADLPYHVIVDRQTGLDMDFGRGFITERDCKMYLAGQKLRVSKYKIECRYRHFNAEEKEADKQEAIPEMNEEQVAQVEEAKNFLAERS